MFNILIRTSFILNLVQPHPSATAFSLIRIPFTLSPTLLPRLEVIFIINQLTALKRYFRSDDQSEKLSNYSLLSLSAFSVHRVQH